MKIENIANGHVTVTLSIEECRLVASMIETGARSGSGPISTDDHPEALGMAETISSALDAAGLAALAPAHIVGGDKGLKLSDFRRGVDLPPMFKPMADD